MSEAVLQAAIVECARALGWMVYHPYDSRRSAAGYPDLTMVNGHAGVGRVIFAELKTDKGALTVAQHDWLVEIMCTPAEAYIWRPADWLDGTVETILRGRARDETA